jgi:phytanoyl-CoA hydroxylase
MNLNLSGALRSQDLRKQGRDPSDPAYDSLETYNLSSQLWINSPPNMHPHPMAQLHDLNPSRLTPDELAVQLGPFGSWPKDSSRPCGYFTPPSLDGAAGFYAEQGYLVLENALSPQELEDLKTETRKLCRNEDGAIDGIAPAQQEMTDEEAMGRVLCVHFPHKLSATILATLAQPVMLELLKQLVGPNLKCMQSMLFVKAAGKPGQAWHQDEDFIPTRDRSLIGAWLALDDATVKNGCLWVLPKSHQQGVLWPQRKHIDSRFDCTHESWNFPWEDSSSIPVEVKAGSIVFFNGYLLHRSLPNRSEKDFRRTLVNHYMRAESLLPWMKPENNTTMALADYRDVVVVAGTDPYAYKGTEDIARAFVRPDLGGGCIDWSDDDQKKAAIEHARALESARSDTAQ